MDRRSFSVAEESEILKDIHIDWTAADGRDAFYKYFFIRDGACTHTETWTNDYVQFKKTRTSGTYSYMFVHISDFYLTGLLPKYNYFETSVKVKVTDNYNEIYSFCPIGGLVIYGTGAGASATKGIYYANRTFNPSQSVNQIGSSSANPWVWKHIFNLKTGKYQLFLDGNLKYTDSLNLSNITFYTDPVIWRHGGGNYATHTSQIYEAHIFATNI